MSKHTEGPWKVNGSEQTTAIWVEDANGKRICTVTNSESDLDHARLIAAAPAYAMAWSLVPDEIRQRIFDALHTPNSEWVEAAIAKATQS